MINCILLIGCFLFQDTYKAKIVTVIDGDTFEVQKDEGHVVLIRFKGIDAPEIEQSYGSEAKQFMDLLMLSTEYITVRPISIDSYGNTLVDAYLPDGTWLNEAIVIAGLAWHDKLHSKDVRLARAEQAAKNLKSNIWQDPKPIAPWEFRHIKKKQ